MISSIVLYLSGFAKLIYFNTKIWRLQLRGLSILPLADVAFWQVWYNFWMIRFAFDSLLQCRVLILHFSIFSSYCILASSSNDFPQPYLPTIITLLFPLSHLDTIYISFFIYLVWYIFCTPECYSSLYYPIFPLLILKDNGSLLPGTALPNTI